ncbi:hypothetical protein [Paenibacillus marinisediminis]
MAKETDPNQNDSLDRKTPFMVGVNTGDTMGTIGGAGAAMGVFINPLGTVRDKEDDESTGDKDDARSE